MLPRQESSRLVAPPPISELLADDIMAPFRHVAALESKQFRGALADAFNEWLHLPPSAMHEVKSIVEMLHNASLIVDDIEDSSNLRRGAPAAHRVYGMPLALNSANTMYFVALSRVMGVADVVIRDLEGLGRMQRPPLSAPSSTDSPPSAASQDEASPLSSSPPATSWTSWVHEMGVSIGTVTQHYATHPNLTLTLCDIFSTEMVELHHGQGLDIYWRDMVQCPTLEEYDEMVLKKTGGLFRLALRFMMALSPLPVCQRRSAGEGDAEGDTDHACRVGELFAALIPLVNDIGVFFQTLDDYLNVCNDDYHKNKSYCEDLTEGKFSYPVIHCLQHQAAKGDKTLLHILRQRPTDVEVKKYCVDMMRKAGSLTACKERVHVLWSSIMSRVESIDLRLSNLLGVDPTQSRGSAKLIACIDKMMNMIT